MKMAMQSAGAGSPLALTALFAGATAIATSALFARVLLGEAVGAVQLLGGVLVLIGIRIAHQAGRDR